MNHQLSSITFTNDLDIYPEENEMFTYKEGDLFVRIFRNNVLKELININSIRSMEVV